MIRRRHNVVLLASAAGLIAALVTPATAAQAGTMVTIATGSVTDSGGRAITGEVDLYAWPDDAVLNGLTAGQTVPTTLLASTIANSNGNYSLSVSLSALQAAAVTGTWANLEVDAGAGSWFFEVDTSNPVLQTVNIPDSTAGPRCSSWTFQHQLNRHWATIGSAYIWNESKGVTGSVGYKANATSHLGIGLSIGGGSPVPGTFTADGSEAKNNSTEVDYPQASTGDFKEYQTQWRTALYKEVCSFVNHWHVRANSWLGGQNIITEGSAPGTNSSYCEPYLKGPGSAFKTSSEKQWTWTGSLGLDISDVSFQATAQTGYGTNSTLEYNFANAQATNYVCGTNSYAPDAGRTVVQSHS